MAKKPDGPPLQKVTLNLHEGDMARMQELFPKTGGSAMIRKIVRNFIERVEAEMEQRPIPDFKLEDLND